MLIRLVLRRFKLDFSGDASFLVRDQMGGLAANTASTITREAWGSDPNSGQHYFRRDTVKNEIGL